MDIIKNKLFERNYSDEQVNTEVKTETTIHSERTVTKEQVSIPNQWIAIAGITV